MRHRMGRNLRRLPLHGTLGTLPGQSNLSAVEWLVAGFGLFVAIAMMLMKVVPAIPGHFTVYEWLALGIWIVLGAIARRRASDATELGRTGQHGDKIAHERAS